MGYLDGGEYFTFPTDPVKLLEEIHAYPMDIFTFLQHPGRTGICFEYSWEPHNLAVIPLSTYDFWWHKQIDIKTRQIINRGKRRGLTTAVTSLNDELFEGIHAIYNERMVRQGLKYKNFGMTLNEVREATIPFLSKSVFIAAKAEGRSSDF